MLALSGQVNRIRCGQLGRQPVVVAVDAAGGVLVAPTDCRPPLRLLNVGFGQQGVSTWGIGLPPHTEGGVLSRCSPWFWWIGMLLST